MKKMMFTLIAMLTIAVSANAMSYEQARNEALFLTDKMAYELNLNDQQYNDAYEINLDYLLSLNTEADLADARYLTYRNDDLRHILYDWQWTAFAAVDYLFRPVWWLSGGWYFPVFRHYAHGYYFYHRPTIFWDYRGGHGRFYFAHGFYHDRRPMWHGGLRGMHNTMIGHPNGPRGGRYGEPGGGRGGFRPEGRGQAGGRSYHFDGNRLTRPDHGGPASADTRSGRSSSRTTVAQPDRSGTRGATMDAGRSTYDRPSRSATTNAGRSSGLTTSRSAGSSMGTSRSAGSSSFGSGRSSMGSSSMGGSRGGSSFGGSRGTSGGSRSMGGSSRGGGRR